jgi:uncharacterized circularly permuted ATP-grasp superfamily protein
MLADAIQHYHDLLTPQLAADSQAQLTRVTAGRQLYFGDRPVCSVLRPRLMTPAQFRFLQQRTHIVLQAFHKAQERALVDASFRAQFGLRDWEENLLSINPGYKHPSPTSRFDTFFVSEQELKFTEFNTETPAGCGYHDILTEMHYGLPIMQEFQRKYQVQPLPARPGVLHALLDSFRQWAGNTSTAPNIAILDWKEVPTYSEFRIFDEYFRTQGLTSHIIDPREVTFTDGKLMHHDYHITLIYKRVLISELYERGGADHPVIQALRAGAVCMVNSFRCKILYKKASLAVMSDERNAGMFTPTELDALTQHVPWTRIVSERKAVYHGQTIDLIPYITTHKDHLVLKPNDEYGGKGIVLGWTVDQSMWEKAVQGALAEPYVVQEKVNLPQEVFPSWEHGAVRMVPRMLDTDPFVTFGATSDACLTRISTDPLLNVTAGGGSTVPTLLVTAR